MTFYQNQKHFILFVCLVGVFVGGSISAQPHTPKRGTAERTAILDAVRFPLQAAVNQNVIFVVEHMKVEGNWAFLKATPQTKAGGPISYKGTKFAVDAEEADELTVALLQKRGGKWVAVSHAYFTTDVWWEGLWNEFPGCPRSIFP
tara:strand:- start:514 stop:951 length:438 start_codon:yes stop_codon:yes gene_type:complete